MRPFVRHTGVAAPLLRANVDTDAIIPSREMKRVSRQGLGEGLFAGWRYTTPGGREPRPDFVLNQPSYRAASILLCGTNFGCGSSREHAVWALVEFGIRALLAPGFSGIFHGNCIRNGLLPVILDGTVIEELAAQVAVDPQGRRLLVDLEACQVVAPDRTAHPFTIAEAHRDALLHGLDPIARTLGEQLSIDAFRNADRQRRAWAYLDD